MMEMCDRRHGQLSKLEIDHVFDLVLNSKELFSVYQNGYSKCVGLKDSPQFVEIDEHAVMRFVIGALCRDVVADMFTRQSQAMGEAWLRAFMEGFENYLVDEVDPALPHDLFAGYQTLVALFAGSLTPVTILNAEEIVSVIGRAIARMRAKLRDETSAMGQLASALNNALSSVVRRSGTAEHVVDTVTVSAFVDRLFRPSPTNPFRNLTLNRRGDP